MRRMLALAVMGSMAIGCSTADQNAMSASETSSPVTARSVARSYTSLTRMTPKPVAVGPNLLLLCAAAAPSGGGASTDFGPHAGSTIEVYMNSLAADAFKAHAPAYPVGAVVVKEKHRDFKQNGSPPAVGGMIKRSAGYDPDHGDWEYFYGEDPAHVDSGKIVSCVECHADAKSTDYVFGKWASVNSQ